MTSINSLILYYYYTFVTRRIQGLWSYTYSSTLGTGSIYTFPTNLQIKNYRWMTNPPQKRYGLSTIENLSSVILDIPKSYLIQ